MFDRIAPRYDLLNRVLSVGIDTRWRKAAADALGLRGEGRVLDLCTGTADLLIEALRRGPRLEGVGVDLSSQMLVRAAGKLDRLGLRSRAVLASGDGERLPLKTAAFDGALVSFGIRNIGRVDLALAELHRALKAGGRLVILEFSMPKGVLGSLYRLYFGRVLPRIGGLVSGDASAYAYLPASVERFHAPGRAGRAHARGGLRGRLLARPHLWHCLSARRRQATGPGRETGRVKRLVPGLQRAALLLKPRRDALLEQWIEALGQLQPGHEGERRAYCTRTLDGLLDHCERGEVEAWLGFEAEAAHAAARAGESFAPLALAIRVLERCSLPHLLAACPEREALAESLMGLSELADRRLEVLLHAQEEESARRLVEAQEQAARAGEKARDLQRANDALRRSEQQSQHRADQIGLLAEVSRRISAVLQADGVMEAAAAAIQARLNYTYVAVVVLDDEGVLVGRWAGRRGVGRRSSGRAQGPPGGVIGRAIRGRAPQVVADVSRDPDYHADVLGTRSEMVVPLLEGGTVVGAIDFQSEGRDAFDLDDVAAGEALAEFVVVALRNARRLRGRAPGLRRAPPWSDVRC